MYRVGCMPLVLIMASSESPTTRSVNSEVDTLPEGRTMMRLYQAQYQCYCDIDLHARSMYVCVLDQAGQPRLHQNLPADPHAFLAAVAPFRDGRVVACEGDGNRDVAAWPKGDSHPAKR